MYHTFLLNLSLIDSFSSSSFFVLYRKDFRSLCMDLVDFFIKAILAYSILSSLAIIRYTI